MKSFFILLTILFLSCSKENDSTYVRTSSSPPQYEGWAGAAESVDRKPHEYFYLSQKGNVKSKRIKPEQMEKACIDSIRQNGFQKITSILITESLLGASYEGDGNINPQPFVNDFKKQKLKMEIKTCSSCSSNPEWSECECLTYIHIPGGKDSVIVKAVSLEAK